MNADDVDPNMTREELADVLREILTRVAAIEDASEEPDPIVQAHAEHQVKVAARRRAMPNRRT